MAHEEKRIALSNLLFDVDNPRLDIVDSQREAIQALVSEQKEKLIVLAEDLVKRGLNPSEKLIVSPSDDEVGHYVVREGNRRIAALKLLSNPDLADFPKQKDNERMKSLSDQFKINPISEISCVVFDGKEEPLHWIRLKHTGPNDGAGIVGWDPQQKSRFESRATGEVNFELQVIDFLRQCDAFDSELNFQLKKIPSTSLRRLLQDPDFRRGIGLEVNKEKKILATVPVDELLKPLCKIITDLASPEFSVKDIYYKDDRTRYLASFQPDQLPSRTAIGIESWEIGQGPPVVDTPVAAPHLKTKGIPEPAPKSQSILKSNARNTVIPKKTRILIKETKANNLYHELRELNVRDFPNASGILFRVFFEVSADLFIEKKSMDNGKLRTLKDKIILITAHLETHNLLSKGKLKGARTACSNDHSIMSIDTFHSYVHSGSYSPDPQSLIIAWDNLEPFILKLWELI